MTMNRRKFFASVGGLAAAAALPATALATTPTAAPVAAPAVPKAQTLLPFPEQMKDAYVAAIRNVWWEPNDAVTRKRIVAHLAEAATPCLACRSVTNFDIIADDRNNPSSIVDSNGNRVTIVYVLPGHIYPRQLELQFHAARRDTVTGELYAARFSVKDWGIDGALSYNNFDA
ncbi:hypothetical protein D3C87_1188370 [compost metagenome]